MLVQKMECDCPSTLCDAVLEAAGRVRSRLSPGTVRQACLEEFRRELERSEVPFDSDVWQPERVGGEPLNAGHVIDVLVDEKIVVVLLAQPEISEEDQHRLLTVLRLSGKQAGLCINFGPRSTEPDVFRLFYEDLRSQA